MTSINTLKHSWQPLERTPAILTASIILTPTNDWRSLKTTWKMLEQLTANRQSCEKLVSLGIERKAILWHANKGQKNYVIENDPDNLMDYSSQELAPAWTFAELCAMIGPDFHKPDLVKPSPARKNSAGQIEPANSYLVYFPDKGITFANGADAAAEVLIFLIEQGKVKPAEANARYSKNFKTQ